MTLPSLPLFIEVQVPSNLDIDVHLLEDNPLVPNARDYLLFILNKFRGKRNYVQINSTRLQKMVQKYSPLLDWLIRREILETDGRNYKVRERPKAYRYSSQYQVDFKIELITNRILIRKIFKNQPPSILLSPPGETETFEDDYINYGYQPRWLRLNQVSDLLALKPIKMKAGLEELDMVNNNHYEHLIPNPDHLFYYESVINKRFWSFGIRFNEDKLDRIRRVSVEYPELFPRKKI